MRPKDAHDDAMDPDPILHELGGFVREQEDAMAAEVDSDPFGPLTDEEQNALTATLLAKLGTGKSPPAPAVLAEVRQLPLPQRRKWPVMAAALSVAAAALLTFWPRSQESELPAYALVLPSPDASHRDAVGPVEPQAAKLPIYALGRELEVLLRPATRIENEIEARAFVEREAGKIELLAIEPARATGGTVIFRVPTGEGTRLAAPVFTRLHFVIGASGMSIIELSSLAEIPKHAQHLVFRFQLSPESMGYPAPVVPKP